jgi:formylglycine-generating enzyme required for sulfatase activity
LEWTADWYDEDRLYHVVRGGSWKTLAEDLRPTHRDFNPPVERMRCVGFRCACSPPPEVDQGSSPGASAVSTVGHGQ